ncbi:MAG: HlyD family efflux transporter periplasmic adaptor subunit [Bacteroidia bacterium]|jgi:HlyD family secretion protein|nr:HlyD family efflux transporter periplasmic adaptor subunit [Bacteroidia bacterium]MBP7245533.1 HlyD family efflux transporter periplasmic adaptor subunit [Bacteroidia bacterium]
MKLINTKNILSLLIIALFFTSCKNGNGDFDATGTFEADEIIVSSETAGRILQFDAAEGSLLKKGELTVSIDTTSLALQSEQVAASIQALGEKTTSLAPYIHTLEQQVEVQKTLKKTAERELKRVTNLVKDDAATQKQLDDAQSQFEIASSQLALAERQLEQQKNTINTQNRSILSEQSPLEKRKAQVDDQLNRSQVLGPIDGTLLLKYAEAGEVTAPGKALFKIAQLNSMNLRAYISGDQLSTVKLGQKVKVFIDKGKDEYKELTGTLTWISDKAEFTPKTIQTKEERAHLVYAVKIKVANDGAIKLGMYGEVKF